MTVKSASRDSYFFVNAKVGNQDSICLLFDTGTSHTILKEDIAILLSSWKIPMFYSKNTPLPLVYNKIKIPFITTISYGYFKYADIRLKTVISENEKVLLYRLQNKSLTSIHEKHPKMQGILGWDFMKQYNWVLDVKTKEVTPYLLRDEIGKYYKEKEVELIVPFYINENKEPTLKLKINNKSNFDVLFDTGFNKWELAIDKNIFPFSEKNGSILKFDDIYTQKYVDLDSVEINDYQTRNISIGVSSERNLLGLGFLGLFDKVIIDNANKQILFLKDSPKIEKL